MPIGPIESLAIAFGVVFLAELGDKTQLMVLAFATRLPGLWVLGGVIVGSGLIMAASVAVGALLGAIIPLQLAQLLAGVLFLAFAAWTWFGDRDDDPPPVAEGRLARGMPVLRAVAMVAGAFLLAELGDKSMLAAMTLATAGDALGTWAGATLAEIGVNAIAIVVGRQLGARISPRLMSRLAALAFAVFGVLLLVEALAG